MGIKTTILKSKEYKGKTIKFSTVRITGGDYAVKAVCGNISAIGKNKEDAYKRIKKKL